MAAAAAAALEPPIRRDRVQGKLSCGVAFEQIYHFYAPAILGWLVVRVGPAAAREGALRRAGRCAARLAGAAGFTETCRGCGVTGHKPVAAQRFAAHLASWAREFRSEVETAARAQSFDYTIPFTPSVGPTEWNHARVEERRRRSLDEIFEEFEKETRRLQDLALELALETLNAQEDFPVILAGPTPAPMAHRIAEVIPTKCAHDRHRFGRIVTWRAGLRPTEQNETDS